MSLSIRLRMPCLQSRAPGIRIDAGNHSSSHYAFRLILTKVEDFFEHCEHVTSVLEAPEHVG